MILACSQWFAPDTRTTADTARNPGQFRRAALTGGMALVITLLLPLAVPGFDQGTFPQGSRLNPWGSSTGLNPMISLGNSLRSPSGDGRITYATNASRPQYLRSVTVDRFDGDSWSPDDRDASRRVGAGRMDVGYEVLADEQVRHGHGGRHRTVSPARTCRCRTLRTRSTALTDGGAGIRPP